MQEVSSHNSTNNASGTALGVIRENQLAVIVPLQRITAGGSGSNTVADVLPHFNATKKRPSTPIPTPFPITIRNAPNVTVHIDDRQQNLRPRAMKKINPNSNSISTTEDTSKVNHLVAVDKRQINVVNKTGTIKRVGNFFVKRSSSSPRDTSGAKLISSEGQSSSVNFIVANGSIVDKKEVGKELVVTKQYEIVNKSPRLPVKTSSGGRLLKIVATPIEKVQNGQLPSGNVRIIGNDNAAAFINQNGVVVAAQKLIGGSSNSNNSNTRQREAAVV